MFSLYEAAFMEFHAATPGHPSMVSTAAPNPAEPPDRYVNCQGLIDKCKHLAYGANREEYHTFIEAYKTWIDTAYPVFYQDTTRS